MLIYSRTDSAAGMVAECVTAREGHRLLRQRFQVRR
jgi:hypothetical protein